MNTGCPSIDKPWMKFYPDGAGDALVPGKSIYQLFKKVEMSGQIAVGYKALPRFWGVLQTKVDEKVRREKGESYDRKQGEGSRDGR